MTPQERDRELERLARASESFRRVFAYIFEVAKWIVCVGSAFTVIGYALRKVIGG